MSRDRSRELKLNTETRRVIHYEPQRAPAVFFFILAVFGMVATWTWVSDVIALAMLIPFLGFIIIYSGSGAVVGGIKGAYIDVPHRRLVLYSNRRFHGSTVLLRVDDIDRLEWKNRSENDRLIAHLRDGRSIGIDYTKAGGVLRLRDALNQLRAIPLQGHIPFE